MSKYSRLTKYIDLLANENFGEWFIDKENDDLKEFIVCKTTITSKDLSSGAEEKLNVEVYIGKVKGNWKVIGIDEKE